MLTAVSIGGFLMRGHRPEKLTLARQDADALHTVARSDSLPWFQVRRAKIVLAIAAGEHKCSVAARLECDEATVWRTCERYQRGDAMAEERPSGVSDALSARTYRSARRLSHGLSLRINRPDEECH